MMWDRKETQEIFYDVKSKTHEAHIVMQNSFKMHKAIKLLVSRYRWEAFTGIVELFM